MDEAFTQILGELDDAFRRLEAVVAPPRVVADGDGYRVRYQEQSFEQMLLMKFARYISGCRAAVLLSEHGFCQEQGAIQRILDDIDEDVMFLVIGRQGDWTQRHDTYVDDFWAEEPKSMVPRVKIRAYIHNAFGEDPSTAIEASRKLFKAYSGYIHSNAVAVIDMCSGEPLRFDLDGTSDNPLYRDSEDDLWNIFFRGLTMAYFVASGIGDEAVAAERMASKRAFEQAYAYRLFPDGIAPGDA
ncbi:hypothetical protein [Novosphingobium guangzhouense]|uniref:Uncharacterized protein n=1 Tax=Novosphingobium guangzhouense TaxID=1850347 RepID=A0A2K2FWG8_9SPHN|nr:hypothetical protein [Novosphingobium guangzhouense]PNU03131.1 hypothetical protein A8V01_24930 [Novosphingobium guangzhouense]